MNSFLQIKNLYEEPTSTSLLFLKQIDPLKAMLEQRCLVFFLRYVEKLPYMDTLEIVKTLFLWCRLCRVDHDKMSKLMAESSLPLYLNSPPGEKDSISKIIYQKMTFYFRAVTSAQSNTPTGEQIQILTNDLHKLKELEREDKNSWSRMSQLVVWLAEEELYTLWVHIEYQLPYFMNYSQEEFDVFYQQYCIFCTHRRKIPLIRHKMLKTVRINIYINQQIQQKGKELREKKEGKDYVLSFKRGQGITYYEQVDE